MPQRANSCPSPKEPSSANAQTSNTGATLPPSSPPHNPLPAQRRAQTCPAKVEKQREREGRRADRQDPPYHGAPQGWEAELPDFVFAASPGADEWLITETDDGRAVYSTVGGGEGSVTIEFQKWDW